MRDRQQICCELDDVLTSTTITKYSDDDVELDPSGIEEFVNVLLNDIETEINAIKDLMTIKDISDISQIDDAYDKLSELADKLY